MAIERRSLAAPPASRDGQGGQKREQEKGKEAALAEGVAIARDMFTKVKQMVQGVQVSAPFGRVEVALQVFQ